VGGGRARRWCAAPRLGGVNTARELAERTEGRVLAASIAEGKIDYAAGRSAKEQLLKKFGVEAPLKARRLPRARLT
jgi:hypothetical protein